MTIKDQYITVEYNNTVYTCTVLYIHIHMYIYIYRVSQEECARLLESVPSVKVYRYNPKHLYPKLNGYGDNGQRKVGASCGSKYCTLHSWYVTWQCERPSVHCACVTLCAVSHVTSPLGFLMYSACNPKDSYDTSASVFVVQFNDFMSLTS